MREHSVRRGLHRLAIAALLVCAGCAGASGSPDADAAPSTDTGSRSGAVAGWQPWTVALSTAEASRTCLPTDRLVVCPVAPAGLVARSASTGAVAWSVGADRPTGRNAGVAADGNRALSAGGRTLRAFDLTTGRPAWTKEFPAGRTVGRPAAADGVVYVAAYGATAAEPQTLFAYRASDGAPLWQRDSTGIVPVAVGSRVYTVESGARAVARDGRTGEVVATSDGSHPCPSLISAPGYLVCASSPAAAGDIFPPVVRIDPDTLAFDRTLLQPVDKPYGGVITPDGVLVLRTVNAEDPAGGDWTAIDMESGSTLWETTGMGDDIVLAGSRVVWVSEGRLVSVDPRGGPEAAGADAPRYSPAYPEAADDRYPNLSAHDDTHLVLQTDARPTLRSVPAP